MSHGESAAAGQRDDQPPWQPDDAFTEDPSAMTHGGDPGSARRMRAGRALATPAISPMTIRR